jgi:hypothetical protein
VRLCGTVTGNIVIRRPVHVVHSFYRSFTDLPRLLGGVAAVEQVADTTYRWIVGRAPRHSSASDGQYHGAAGQPADPLPDVRARAAARSVGADLRRRAAGGTGMRGQLVVPLVPSDAPRRETPSAAALTVSGRPEAPLNGGRGRR